MTEITSDIRTPTPVGGNQKERARQVAAIWLRAVHAPNRSPDRSPDTLNPEDDFFAAGGDSVSALTMLLELEDVLRLRAPIPQADFLDHPTLARLTELVNTAAAASRPAGPETMQLELVKSGRSAAALYLICTDFGEASPLRRLAELLSGQCSVALVHPSPDAAQGARQPFERRARDAVSAIRQAGASGPYILAGFQEAGVLAFEAGRQLEQAGERALLVLFDVAMPGSAPPRRGPWGRLQSALDRILDACGLGRHKPTGTAGDGAAEITDDPAGYRPAPTHLAALHFIRRVSGEERDTHQVRRCLEWKTVCLAGVTVHWLTGSSSVLDESHLPATAAALDEWLSRELH